MRPEAIQDATSRLSQGGEPFSSPEVLSMRSYLEEVLATWSLADKRERHRCAIERAIEAIKHPPSACDRWWRWQRYRGEGQRRKWSARGKAMPPWGWRQRHSEVMKNGAL